MQKRIPQQQAVSDSRKQILRFIRAQVILTVILPLLLWIYSWVSCYSALIGGVIATTANTWFAFKVFSSERTEQPTVILATFYMGEIYKFLLTAALFMVVFVLIKPINIVVLLSVYFFVHMIPAVVNTFSVQSEKKS